VPLLFKNFAIIISSNLTINHFIIMHKKAHP